MGAFSAVSGALVRRGFEIHQANGKAPATIEYEMPMWGMCLVAGTLIVFVGLNFMIEYTYGRIVPTLLMIESPEAVVFEPLKDSIDPDSKTPEAELLFVKQAPITSSFRSTIQHLRTKAGRFSRFRGFSIYLITGIALEWYMKVISNFLPHVFAPFLAMFLCAPFYLVWTHIVISNPSPLSWFKRLPNMATLKKVLVPTAHYALAKELTLILPTYLAQSYGLLQTKAEDALNMSKNEFTITFFKGLSVLALAGALAFLVLIPSIVSLTRVQASTLPEENESIVPFDRSFGGKVVPEMVGGKGVLGMLDAWRTFDWNSRIRLLKAYVKVFAMEVALSTLLSGVLMAEAYAIFGDDLKKIVDAHKNGEL